MADIAILDLIRMGFLCDVRAKAIEVDGLDLATVSRRGGDFAEGSLSEAMIDAQADKGVRIVDAFPSDSCPPIVYPAAVLASSKSAAARPFLAYLRSAPAKPTWERYGFALAQ